MSAWYTFDGGCSVCGAKASCHNVTCCKHVREHLDRDKAVIARIDSRGLRWLYMPELPGKGAE